VAIQLDDLVARLRLDTSGVGTGLSSLNSSLSSVGDKATAAGRKMTLGVTTPLVGIGIASTKLAATFDKTMRQVSIATGGPSKALQELAIRMGAETAFSANEAADAMLELAKGGMTAAQIEGGALAATMKLASAGGVALADASTYVSNSMAAFGLSAKDADSVTVALAGAANASSASVESLGQGLSQAAAAAVNAGLSLQETTGVLSLFDSVGLKGSDAGTSLKSMLNSLIPTTEKASDAMARANLDFVDAEGNFVGVADMAEQLKRGLGDLSEAQRAQALETIFGSDGMRAASALMRGGREEVVKYTKASRDQKTTTELANAAMEGTSGAMERAAGSIETAGLALGQVLAPYVERAAAKVEELANRFTELSPETQEMIVKGAALAAVLGPLVLTFGVLASSVAKMIGVMTAAKGAMIAFTTVAGEGDKRVGSLAATAKRAAGIGGVLALGDGLRKAASEGNSFSTIMQGAAGGAGIGAMFGPIGALVGAGVGGGLTALVGSFKRTSEEAEAARLQLLKTEGFANAKADADTLREALVGVSNAYGSVTRSAVEASFTGKDGKLDADIAKLRELGVSMDTIVSATLGRADAQKIVDSAIGQSLTKQQTYAAEAKAAYDNVSDGLRDVVTQSGQVIKNGESLSNDEVKIYEDAWRKAANAVKETETNQRTFSARVEANTGAIRENRKQVRELADSLGVTVKQYKSWPKEARTRIEADGLPQTMRDSLKLIGQYDDLQSFRNIRAIVEATNAPLTIQQIETLTKRYNLTPKQVKTLVDAVGVETETGKIVTLRREAESAAGTYTVKIHTAYTYSGLKSPTRGRGDDFSPRAASGGGKAANDDAYDYGSDLGESMVDGLLSQRGKAGEAGEKTADEATKGAKRRKALIERVGRLLSSSFADGIAGGRDHVVAQMKRVMDAVEATQNKRAIQLAVNTRKALLPLAREFGRLREQYVAAERALTDLEAARTVVEQRQGALSMAGGDLGSLTFDEETPVTAGAVIAALEQVSTAATQFDSHLQQLKDAGLSQDALDQLIAKGPEAAAATAQAILAGGPEAIARINALQTQIANAGLSIQAKSSQTMYDAGVAAQQGLISGLESQMEALEGQMNKIAKAMVRAIRKALKIKSPSRVMEGLGEYTGIGFANGIDSTVRAVSRASDRMADAATLTPPTYADPAMALLAARRSVRAVQASQAAPSIRVFIGERELTDIVDVRIDSTLAPLSTLTRQGAL
jgi:TP901 family phage tail tape measure protein